MREKKIPVWLDTDTGVDDAAAILTALQQPALELVGISSAAGNVEQAKTFRNARAVVALAKTDVKVYPGAEKPLRIPLVTAPYVHGTDGLGGAVIPDSTAPKETMPAWDALYEAARKYKGELVTAAVGPLTNIAYALFAHPDLKDYVKEIVIMGGAAEGGNVTPCAEFNIYADPEAAEAVFGSGIPMVMAGLDVTMKAYITRQEMDTLASHPSPVTDFTLHSLGLEYAFTKKLGMGEKFIPHDVCALLYIAHPEMFKKEKAGVHVELNSSLARGKTVTDLWSDAKFADRHVEILLDVDREAFVQQVLDALRRY